MTNNSEPVISAKNMSWRNGKLWFDVGLELFKQVKNYWYLNCLLLIVFITLVSAVAMQLVSVVVIFTSPFITAFLMNACDKAVHKKSVPFTHLWQTVFNHFNALMLLGVVSAILSTLMHFVHLQLLQTLELSPVLTETMVGQMSGKEAFIRAILNIMVNLPIALALAFSPALIILNSSPTITAVKYSAYGVIKSWKAFVTLMLMFVLLLFAAVVVVSFVMTVLMTILGPASQMLISAAVLFLAITAAGIGLCAQYQAYTEIYQQPPDDESDEIYAEI